MAGKFGVPALISIALVLLDLAAFVVLVSVFCWGASVQACLLKDFCGRPLRSSVTMQLGGAAALQKNGATIVTLVNALNSSPVGPDTGPSCFEVALDTTFVNV